MSASPLPPQSYRTLRARYNALLATLYERTSLTLPEIAAIAGRTDHAVQIMARKLGCRLRHPTKGRPGNSRGVRHGPRPPQLNAPAVRRVVAAFAAVARELAGSADAQAATGLERAAARAARRTARAKDRSMASAARELGHLAVVIENTAAARHALAAGGRRKAKPAKAPRWPSRAEMQERQERLLREGEARMREAHKAAERRREAAAEAAPPSDADRRINEIAERYYAAPRRGPRIRGL